MKDSKYIIFMILALWTLLPVVSMAQTIDELHGDELYSFRGWHSGNMIRTCFYNDGDIGWRSNEPDGFGEWPINSGHTYINLITYFFGAEVKDRDGLIQHIVSEGNGVNSGDPSNAASGDADEAGNWQTMAPLPGFANEETQEIAMSHKKDSWPATWPDKFDDVVDPGWAGSWNGYFGKDILNADQESYYVMDDYLNNEFAFYPDENDSTRRGLGFRGTVRGFQWSNVLVEDILFQLVDIKNIGTVDHAKVNFGIVSGPVIGRAEGASGSDGSDDGASFDLARKFGWHWDLDDIGMGGWSPVGKHGFAFYESPGNPYDGIDNDDDAIDGAGPVIDESMFAPKMINTGDEIVLIDYTTFERTVTTMPAEGVTITYLENEYHFAANTEHKELDINLIDDNLNGIIDESNGYVFGEGDDAVANYLNIGRKYINYFTGEGADNILLEERRDDGIDNDGDWDINFDDVGLDGVAKTGDPGEGDGVPTSGRGTDLPGEPHIDKTDIDESDMIGLTAFNIFTWGDPKFSDDPGMWAAIEPGYLNAFGQTGDTDLMLGSGYFPLAAGDIERFSIGIMFGDTEDDIFTNNEYGSKAYHENYNFAKAPYIPTLTAVPGNGKVTLMWDDFAEKSLDPITGYDFEGYRIYRSTDPGWNDMIPVTDGFGSVTYRKPMAQYDLVNEITGYAGVSVRGVRFYRGDDTGLTHTFVDTTVKNGYLYYYAVTSYDSGSDTLGISPTECSKYIAIAADGTIDKGNNVAIARPESPSAGFVEAGSQEIEIAEGSTSDGMISVGVALAGEIQDGHRYRVVFEDTLVEVTRIPYPSTKNISLIDVTDDQVLIDRDTTISLDAEFPITDGFRFGFESLFRTLELNTELSGWNRAGVIEPNIRGFSFAQGEKQMQVADFAIIVGEMGMDSSTTFMRRTEEPGMPVNFTVWNLTENRKMKFGFRDEDTEEGMEGILSAYNFDRANRDDEIIILNDSLVAGWEVAFTNSATDTLQPQPGDTLFLFTNKPFLSNDVLEFVMNGQKIDADKAKVDMDLIRVVPNPYVVAASWEPQNPYASGRGPRELHFINLPQECTLRIFNVRGQLINTLEHNSTLTDGTYIWDMLTKDLLDISYGVYVYHVDAGDTGSKIGKFAVIK